MTIKTTERPRAKIDPERWHRLKDILAEALEHPSLIDRAALLENRCANDAPLRGEAESLVKEAEALRKDPTDSLEDCAEHATAFLWQDETPRNGWRIGAYVVTKELGRGGMGAVYLAERADGQFEKEVAIKVLKRGTDTDELLQRFAAERHILARLDHPNIAHLLDAGTTDDGLPYFVMEDRCRRSGHSVRARSPAFNRRMPRCLSESLRGRGSGSSQSCRSPRPEA